MDAVEFLRAKSRMCENIPCSECDLNAYNNGLRWDCNIFIWKHPVDAVKTVEQWSKENQIPTRQDKFLKHYPNAELNECTGALVLCPSQVFGGECDNYCRDTAITCGVCCKNFWLAPIEEENE